MAVAIDQAGKQDIEIIFIDFDNTSAYNGKLIPEVIIDIKKYLSLRKTHKVIWTTGRSKLSMDANIKPYFSDEMRRGQVGYITSGGNAGYNSKMLWKATVPLDISAKVLECAHDHGVSGAFHDEEKSYSTLSLQEHEAYNKFIGYPLSREKKGLQIYTADFTIEKHPNFFIELETAIGKYYNLHTYTPKNDLWANQACMHILFNHYDKASGVRLFAEMEGVDLEKTMVLDDQVNGRTMLEMKEPITVVMGNAPQILRDSVLIKFVTKHDLENGAGYAMRKIIKDMD